MARDLLIEDEPMRRLLRALTRRRLYWGLPWSFACLAVLAPLGLPAWRWAVIAGLLGALGALYWIDARRSFAAPRRTPIERYGALLALVHGVALAVTGGVRSPLLPILLPMLIVTGALAHASRTALVAPLAASAGLVALALLELGGVLPPLALLGPASAAHLGAILFVAISVLFTATLAAGALMRAHVRTSAELAAARQGQLLAEQERLRSLEATWDRVSHEVRNPLAAIGGLAQLLRREGASPHLDVLCAEVDRLRDIVDRMPRASIAPGALRRGAVELRAMANGLRALLSERLEGAGVSMEVHVPERLLVSADEVRLRQLLLNLLLNAVEALEAHDGPRRIEVVASLGEERVELRIVDTGPGPPIGAGELLFEPYVSTKGRGSGVGLATSRAIARAHGGDLALERLSPAGGAAAVLWLPAEAP
jgi:signal transduction histidine kinase